MTGGQEGAVGSALKAAWAMAWLGSILQSLEAMFCHIPGLKVVMPSTPYDAKGCSNPASEMMGR